MAFTVEDVIKDARDQHPSFDERRTTDITLLRQLNRYVRQLTFRTIEKDSSSLPETIQEITFPLADHETGEAVSGLLYRQGGTLTMSGNAVNKEAFNLVPFRNRFMPNMHSAGYIHGGYIHFCGDAADWVGVEKVELHYIPEPTPATALADAVPLPDGAKLPCVDHLAWFQARRQGVYEGMRLDVLQFKQDWKESEHEYLVEIAQHSRGEANYVREEW